MCDFPIYTKKGYVPCGKCSDCIGTLRQDWNNRLYHEAFNSVLTLFVTLTYSDENLIFGIEDEPILNYPDVTKYFKRLRKADLKFKYFYVGEYGERSGRPHYHCIFFFDRTNDLVYLENLLHSKWSKTVDDIQISLGQISIFLANQAMLKYTTKDMMKEIYSFHHLPKDLRPRLFASKLLGCSYVEQYKNFHRQSIIDRQKMAINGHKYGLPRYYREKIFTKDERDFLRLDNETNRRHYHSLSEIQNPEFVRKTTEEKRLESQVIEAKLKKRLKITHFKKSL